MPTAGVSLLPPYEDLLPKVPPSRLVSWKEEVAYLADPAKRRLALGARYEKAVPDLRFFLKLSLVCFENVLLCLGSPRMCLVAELTSHSGCVHLQDVPCAEAAHLRLGDMRVNLLVCVGRPFTCEQRRRHAHPRRSRENVGLHCLLICICLARRGFGRFLLCPASKIDIAIVNLPFFAKDILSCKRNLLGSSCSFDFRVFKQLG
mmetsp:Transcript_100020/g.173577  ORF Transcript_100020/g.173577 Transcript_100020/m.173577 type:complete len:204 (-) Transcript_100020:494-1105(-)